MDVRTRVRGLTILALIVLIAGGVGAYYSVSRVNSLWQLRLETQRTLTHAYKLLVDTTELVRTHERLRPAYDEWAESVALTAGGIERVLEHPLVGDLPVSERLSGVEGGWNSAQGLFNLADEELSGIMAGELTGTLTTTGLDIMELQLRDREHDMEQARWREEMIYIRNLQRRLRSAMVHSDYFVTGTLQTLADETAVATAQEVQRTILITAIAVGALLAAAIGALVAGTRFLEVANRNLERNVRERTRAIQSLLDFSGQGFLSFGPDLIVGPEHSRECEQIFGTPIVGEWLPALLYDEERRRSEFSDALALVFSGTCRPEVAFELLDDTVDLNEKVVELEFRRIDASRMMCSLRDVTEERRLSEKVAEANELREMLLGIVVNRAQFARLRHEAQQVLDAMREHVTDGFFEASRSDRDVLVRTVHTFKANAGVLKLSRVVDAAHQLEQAMSDLGVLTDGTAVAEALSSLERTYRSELQTIEEHLGSEWVSEEETVVIPRTKLERLERKLRHSGNGKTSAAEELRELQMLRFGELEPRFSGLLEDLAGKRGKRLAPLRFEGGDVKLEMHQLETLSHAITHLIRNMVDHGIERPREREAAGKAPEGEIKIAARERNGSIDIAVEDDGRGINLEAVRRTAIERGLLSSDAGVEDAQLLRIVFKSGFSTAAAVTATSGRGVGMTAVRDAMQQLNGRISVMTGDGQGTRFVMRVPRAVPQRISQQMQGVTADHES